MNYLNFPYVCFRPGDLDHHEIFGFNIPYLGKFVSVQSDLNLLPHNPKLAKDDLWQFNSFFNKLNFVK
jgi:hypothetical protein